MMSDYFNVILQMRKRYLKRFLLCIIVLLPMQSLFAVEVITNSDNVAQMQGSNNLRSIFSMRTRYWPNGEKIRVFVLADDSEVHKKFVKQKLQMFPHQLRRTWDRMTYTGTGQPPITVHSTAEMLEKIKTTKNSIGYIDRRVEDEAIHFFDAQ
ncbi:MAG: hypothetical protein methR_P2035 [Methyloprofundus sp.]|nr:MAG: hypothetical protein methR_P2035 [Methyloprofundus sp.]